MGKWKDLSEDGKRDCIKRWRRESTHAYYPISVLEKLLGSEGIDEMLIKQKMEFCTTGTYGTFGGELICAITDAWK